MHISSCNKLPTSRHKSTTSDQIKTMAKAYLDEQLRTTADQDPGDPPRKCRRTHIFVYDGRLPPVASATHWIRSSPLLQRNLSRGRRGLNAAVPVVAGAPPPTPGYSRFPTSLDRSIDRGYLGLLRSVKFS